MACVSPGDEVVIIEPAYDSYRPSIALAGGKAIAVSLETIRNSSGQVSSYAIPWGALQKAINPKTRLIIINTPHNPTGMVWQKADLDRLANLVKETNALILSDEVYEHMVYDGEIQHPIKTLSFVSVPIDCVLNFLGGVQAEAMVLPKHGV